MRVKHYPRVSSPRQAESGDSVDFQDKRLKQHSESNKDEIVGVHTDSGKSASISDDKIQIRHKDGFIYAKIDIRKRPGMNEILNSLKDKSWDALKVTKWDRFSRNDIFSQLMILYFKEHDKEIIAVDDSNDSLVRGILSILGQEEIKKMKSRVRDVRLNQFDKGIVVGRVPFGYKGIFKDKKNRRGIIKIVPDEKKAKIVKEIFQRTAAGESYRICYYYKLKPQSYYDILKNKVYIGIISFEGKEKKGIHEPIISEDLFNQVNKGVRR